MARAPQIVQEAGNSNRDLVPMCSSNDFQTGSALESNKPKVYYLPGPKTQMERYGIFESGAFGRGHFCEWPMFGDI